MSTIQAAAAARALSGGTIAPAPSGSGDTLRDEALVNELERLRTAEKAERDGAR